MVPEPVVVGHRGALGQDHGGDVNHHDIDHRPNLPCRRRNHWRGVIAVVDDGGWLIMLERMDHAAMTASVDLAMGKARSAALFKKPTQDLEDAINHGRYAAITARGFIEMQGGIPVVMDEVVGAIGASFATPDQDVRVARAGLAALGP
jgi:glc operon protein GlcG